MQRYFRQLFGFFITSFKALWRTPSGWLFGFLFPVIFVVIFGYISNDSKPEIKVGFVYDDSSIYAPIKSSFEASSIFVVTEKEQSSELNDDLANGNLDAFIQIKSKSEVLLVTNANRPENVSAIKQTLDKINTELTLSQLEVPNKAFVVEPTELNSRKTRYIDFVLPGILGYSIMTSAIFGVAYSFLTLRKDNVLKRFFAGPSKISAFILGESMSRSIFILLQNALLLAVAATMFGYTPRNGLSGFFEIGVVIAVGLLTFLGFGYAVAGVAKSDEVVSPVANLIVLPQFILAGTFFTVSSLPNWLQMLTKFMPLYHFNEAIRAISIDGAHLLDKQVFTPIGILIVWSVVVYGLASKFFKVR